jgi:hypothetical protein
MPNKILNKARYGRDTPVIPTLERLGQKECRIQGQPAVHSEILSQKTK